MDDLVKITIEINLERTNFIVITVIDSLHTESSQLVNYFLGAKHLGFRKLILDFLGMVD